MPKGRAKKSPSSDPKAERPENRDILDVDQAAFYLGVARSTLYKLVQRREVPCMRLGGSVRFSRRQLLEWVEEESRKTLGAKEGE